MKFFRGMEINCKRLFYGKINKGEEWWKKENSHLRTQEAPKGFLSLTDVKKHARKS